MFIQKRRLIILFIVGLLILVQVNAFAVAAPTDPFNGSTPTFDAAPAEGIDLNTGDWGVSDQNGVATYTLPISLPPGRNGMAPALSLRYSSNSPLRGGIAVGWTMDIPTIELDHELGVEDGAQYRASLGSASGRIIGETIQFDTSNTRVYMYDPDPIEPGPHHWVALTTDGVRHYFEEVASELINGRRLDTKWRLTRQVDPFGNTVEYEWADIIAPNDTYVIDQSLVRIEFSSNAAAGLVAHAKVEFEYASLEVCNDSNVPIGAAVRKGSQQVDGAQKLTTVQIYARDSQSSDWRLSKEIELTYKLRNSVLYDDPTGVVVSDGPSVTTFNCRQNLLRYLTQADVTAYAPNGEASSMPAIKFDYNGRLDLSLPTPRPTIPSMEREISLSTPGYGQAGTSGGSVDGLQNTLLDIDNDGIRDFVSVIEESAVCKLLWRKGLYGGGFEAQGRKALLPTSPWYREWRGVSSSPIDDQEGCTLSGQIAYRSVPANDLNVVGDEWAKGIVSYHFMDYTGDGRLDLITNVWAPDCHWTYDPWATLILNDPVCSFGNPLPRQIGGLADPIKPEEDRGRYIWRVYAGTGNPDDPFLDTRFLDAPTYPAPFGYNIKSPVPMPPATSDEKLDDSHKVVYSVPALFDIDGDGFLDIVVTKATNLTRAACGTPLNEILLRGCDWTVYLGNGSGTFPTDADAYVWDVPKVTLSTDQGDPNTPCGPNPIVNALLDINGDGLADLVARLSNGAIVYYRNTGAAFDLAPITVNSASPVEETQVDCTLTLGGELLTGERHYLIRMVDLDQDGLLDMARFEVERGSDDIVVPNKVSARFNLGDRFGELKPLLYSDVWIKGARTLSAANGNWRLDTDFTDVNGDGFADLVEWQADSLTYVSSPGIQPASDRLRLVTNGQGMQINFSYATSTNQAIVNRTDPSSLLPYVSWVVDEVTVEGGFGTPSVTTEYRYATPNFLPIETPYSRFTGYRETNGTLRFAGGGVQRVQNVYLYDVPSAQGYKVKSVTYQDGEIHQVNRQEWQHLAGGAYPTVSTSCTVQQVGLGEAACFAQDDHVLRSEKTWQIDSGLVINRQQLKGVGTTPRNGDRTSTYDYEIRIGPGDIPDDYRVLLHETVQEERAVNGTMIQTGRSVTELNAATGLPDKTRAHFDAATFSELHFGFDGATGNLISLQKPMQNVGNGGAGETSQFGYDSHQLFVSQTTNELNHVVRATYDVATGVLVKRAGPNQLGTLLDTEQWRIDGFGRSVSHSISVDIATPNGASYVEKTIEKTEYNDFNYFDTGEPITIRTEQLRDFDDDTSWIPTERSFDGMGRAFGVSERFNGVMTPISTMVYNDQGQVHTVTAPDPSNAAASITYEYAYDSLGRVVKQTRPDGGGTTIAYVGLTQVISEDAADGSGGSSTQRYDAFGRLVQVQETTSNGQSAVNNYVYDAHDNVRQISDADGTVTRLEHDYLSNRTGISRGDRVWAYVYDLNGNLVSQQSPVPTNGDASHYRVDYAYDVLDRIDTTTYFSMRLSTVPAVIPGGPGSDGSVAVYLPVVMTGPSTFARIPDAIQQDAAMQVIESIEYDYDSGANGIGRLSQVVLPVGNIQYGYEARGLVAEEQRSFTLSGIANFSASQSVKRTYNALGQLTHSLWDDGQQWTIAYDDRALVDIVSWFDPATSTFKAVADYERALSGLPLARGSAFGQTQTFGYDTLARPLDDAVTINGSPNPLAERRYVYSDSGDLASVIGQTNGVSANAGYTYDAQHRLLTAAGPNSYRGEFSYSAAGNVLSADVTWDGSAESRDVTYGYGAVDAQAVDHLQNVASNTAYAVFAYDPVGNMTYRRTPQGETLLHWNALGQVRAVETPNGAETYFYDHRFQRLLLVNAQEGVRFWFGERETHYDLGGVEDLNYLHLAAGGPALARVENGTAIELQYADALQNLMFSLDSTGNVVASFLYGPFGEVVAETGGADHRRQFNGKENDAATGLRYYGYRYYDPLTLRWSSADPLYTFVPELGLHGPQRMNLYAFSLNNPVRYYDPDGREAKEDDTGDTTPEPVDCGSSSEASNGCDDDTSKAEDDKKQPSPTVTAEDLDRLVAEAMNACTTTSCAADVMRRLQAACKGSETCQSWVQNRYWRLRNDRIGDIQRENEFSGRGPNPNKSRVGIPPPVRLEKSVNETLLEQNNAYRGDAFGFFGYILANSSGKLKHHKRAHAAKEVGSGIFSILAPLTKAKTTDNINTTAKVYESTRQTPN